MEKDLVLGIDSSTSATKATAWTRDGTLVAEGRKAIPLSNPQPGYFEQNTGDWWASTVTALKELFETIDPGRIAAISISNQRETFALFDEDANPVRMGIVWLDGRGSKQVDALAQKVGSDRIREICGKPVDPLVPINRMIWLRENEPENFARAAHYSDVHCYLTYKLTGNWITSTASADPSGMLDIASGRWSDELLAAAEIPKALMPALATPGSLTGHVDAKAAEETGLMENTPVIAGGGDGQCAACGAGVAGPSNAYMNLGTALVSGVYSPIYRHDQAFRTETAISDSGFILETVLKSGTFLIDWFAREIGGVEGEDRAAFLKQIEKEAEAAPIGAGGIVILPFWEGSMTPHWDANARGIIAGLSGSSKRGDIYRALLEGLALDQAFALEKAMQTMNGEISKIIAIGGGTASQLLLQIIADSINVPVYRAEVAEASALGAAMCAAKGAGWYATLHEASGAMSQKNLSVTKPIEKNVRRYAELRTVYDALWPSIADWNRRLRSFADKD